METTTQKTLAHLLPIAQRAYNWTSFNPEKRGQGVVDDYSAELDADIASIREAAAKNSEITAEAIDSTCERYRLKYETLLKNYLHSHSNVASAMITGPARFPTARNQKRMNWAEGHYNTFRTYRERALKAIIKSFKKQVDPLEAYRKDLANRLAYHETAVKANKLIRKFKGNEAAQFEALVNECGMSESTAREVLTPDYIGRTGYARFELTNNLANIKRIQDRINYLEKLATLEVKEKELSGGVKVVDNPELNRVQILFPDKPSEECRSALKSAGFKWAPSQSAWQNFRNQRNYDKAKEIVSQFYK